MAQNKISYLLEDINGEHAYSNERAQFGYVKPHERLKVPKSLVEELQTEEKAQKDIKMDARQMLQLIYGNYKSLAAGGYNNEKAIRISVLRAKWVHSGNLLKTAADRKTPFDEVDYITPGNDWDFINPDGTPNINKEGLLTGSDKFKDFCKAFNDCDIEHWNMQAPILWAIAAHVFRVRGHHYKIEYDSLYERTYKGTVMNLPDSHLSWQDIGRTAIHSFGVKALERTVKYYQEHYSLTTNILLRRDAVPCGGAIVGTAYAALMQLRSTPWYNAFEKQYSGVINGLIEDFHEMQNAGLRAHISHRLYGLEEYKIKKENAYALAPLLCGYVRATPATTAIRAQKSLDLPADSNPLMMNIFQKWLVNQVERAGERENLAIAMGLQQDDDPGEGRH